MKNLVSSAWNAYREKGLGHLAGFACRGLLRWHMIDLPYSHCRTFKSRAAFVIQGREYRCLHHKWDEDPTGHVPVLGQPSRILEALSVLEPCPAGAA